MFWGCRICVFGHRSVLSVLTVAISRASCVSSLFYDARGDFACDCVWTTAG